MKQLNQLSSHLATEFNLRAATDVTGYSLLGHGWEMAHASEVGMQIDHSKVPFLTNARKYAEAGCFPGGAITNRMHYAEHISFGNTIDEITQMLLFDPQTSGGLLLAVPEQVHSAFLKRAKSAGQPVWEIGFIAPGNSIEVV
jgi:selenide,water dikinase